MWGLTRGCLPRGELLESWLLSVTKRRGIMLRPRAYGLCTSTTQVSCSASPSRWVLLIHYGHSSAPQYPDDMRSESSQYKLSDLSFPFVFLFFFLIFPPHLTVTLMAVITLSHTKKPEKSVKEEWERERGVGRERERVRERQR
jgi:hypothetical protein